MATPKPCRNPYAGSPLADDTCAMHDALNEPLGRGVTDMLQAILKALQEAAEHDAWFRR